MTDSVDKKLQNSGRKSVRRLDEPGVPGRRALLKRAVVAMPMILTLQSGAALARSSNMISATSPANAKDSLNRTLCLNYQSVESSYGDDTVDIGNGTADVTAITERRYYVEKNGDEIEEWQICERGGYFSYRNRTGPWQQTNYVPKGMLISLTAATSIANMSVTEI